MKNKIDNYLNKLPYKYQDGALLLAYYATFPVIISADLLYLLWLNFPDYTKYGDEAQTLPIIAVSDLLQSTLCEEIGFNHFEMKHEICIYLKQNIYNILAEKQLSIPYIAKDFYAFTLEYAHKFCQKPTQKNLFNFYYWEATMILFPEKANTEIKKLLGGKKNNESSKLSHDQSQLIITLAEKQAHNKPAESAEKNDINKLPTLSAQNKDNSKAITDIELIEIVEQIIPDIFILPIFNETGTIEDIIDLLRVSSIPKVPIEEIAYTDIKLAYSTNEFGEIIGLTLRNKEITQKQLTLITKFIKLQKLYLGGNYIEDISILNNLKELRELGLNFNKISSKLNSNLLNNLSQLETLYLKNNRIEEVSATFLDGLSALKEIYLQGNPIQNIPQELLETNENILAQIKNYFTIPYNKHIISPNITNKLPKIFISYSKKDLEYLDDLETHLSMLERQKLIDTWNVGDSQNIKATIDTEVKTADIILLLVSARYLANLEIWDNEITIAVERHKRKEAILIPIILSLCDWTNSPFAGLVTLPKNSTVSGMDRDEAFAQIAKELKNILAGLKQERNPLNLKAQISEITSLIGNAQLEEALDLLDEIAPKNLKGIVILLKNRLNNIQKNLAFGHIDSKEEGIQRNKIVYETLALCEDIIQNHTKIIANEAQNLIKLNDLAGTLNLLEVNIPENFKKDVLMLQARFTHLERNTKLGTISANDESIERGKITDAITAICNELSPNDISSDKTHKDYIQELLAEDKLDAALGELLKGTEISKQEDLHNNVLLLFGRNTNNTGSFYRKYTISQDSFSAERAKIISAVHAVLEKYKPVLEYPKETEENIDKLLLPQEDAEIFKPEVQIDNSSSLFEHGYALFIGINYANWHTAKLRGPLNDVKDLYTYFIHPQKARYKPENIILLTEERATRYGIMAALDKLINVSCE